MRNEIVLTTKGFLEKRLDESQQGVIENLKLFLEARTSETMINAARNVVSELFGAASVLKFSEEVIGHFEAGHLHIPSNLNDHTGILYNLLRISVPGTIFSKLVKTYISITPHSAGPERAVSCYNTLKSKKQSSLARKTINNRMYISLNSPGTAHFDPRPAVARYLQMKDRRVKNPDPELYKKKKFTQKFFSKESNV